MDPTLITNERTAASAAAFSLTADVSDVTVSDCRVPLMTTSVIDIYSNADFSFLVFLSPSDKAQSEASVRPV